MGYTSNSCLSTVIKTTAAVTRFRLSTAITPAAAITRLQIPLSPCKQRHTEPSVEKLLACKLLQSQVLQELLGLMTMTLEQAPLSFMYTFKYVKSNEEYQSTSFSHESVNSPASEVAQGRRVGQSKAGIVFTSDWHCKQQSSAMKVPENKEQTMRNDGEARLGGILTNYDDLFGTKDIRTAC